MIFYSCDVCKQTMEHPTEPLLSLKHGGLLMDVKVGIHRIGEGHVCNTCIRQTLTMIAEHGIISGRKITLPEDLKPLVESLATEKRDWTIR